VLRDSSSFTQSDLLRFELCEQKPAFVEMPSELLFFLQFTPAGNLNSWMCREPAVIDAVGALRPRHEPCPLKGRPECL
jgi:hypothetical protein